MNEEILVSIWCTAYNHESYIRQCLEGFVMQKTNFKFEAIVHDDASTDGTAAIIREYAEKYPDIVKPIFQTENQYSQKHINMMQTFFMPRAKGKYIALCEGDDYWTDPYKLQKQVDFLEANPEYSFCCHRFQIYKEVEKKYIREYGYKLYKSGQNLIIDEHVFFSAWVTQWLTTMVRTDIYKECVRKSMEMFASGLDVYFYFLLLQRGNGVSLNDYMGVYRWHSKGVSIGRTSVEKVKNGYVVNYNLFSKFPNKPILLVRMKYYAIRLLGYYNCLNKENMDFYKKSMFLWITKKEKVKSFIIFVLPPFIWSFMRDFYGFFIFRK